MCLIKGHQELLILAKIIFANGHDAGWKIVPKCNIRKQENHRVNTFSHREDVPQPHHEVQKNGKLTGYDEKLALCPSR